MSEAQATWWVTELYPTKDTENFGLAGDFEVMRIEDVQSLRDERDRLRSTIRTLCSSGNRLLDDLIGRSEAAESFKYHVKQAQAALTSAGGQERANDSHIG